MRAFGKLAVILATTLAGSHLRLETIEACANTHDFFQDCAGLDALVPRLYSLYVFGFASLVILVLGFPCLVLDSRHTEKMIQALLSFFAAQTSALLFSNQLPRGPAYALAVHACVFNLLSIEYHPYMIGGRAWWGLRYPAVLSIVIFAAYYGPPVSLVQWPGIDSINCAARAHLVGALFPELTLAAQKVVMWAGEALLDRA